MKKKLFFIAIIFSNLIATLVFPAFAANPKVHLETDNGDITIELFADKSPITVENFLSYLRRGYYDGVLFHRVSPDYIVQSGGYTFDFTEKKKNEPIQSEVSNGLKNTNGTVAMARKSDPDSATSEFFINLRDNPNLDPSDDKAGYTVFGRVIEGLDVAIAISKQPTGLYKKYPDAPNDLIRILKAREIKD
ncbi:peptidylprolyl isomerase [Aurantivibrio infirmus]